jgi:hypothetical protein
LFNSHPQALAVSVDRALNVRVGRMPVLGQEAGGLVVNVIPGVGEGEVYKDEILGPIGELLPL